MHAPKSPPPPAPQGYLPTLDGWRALAVLWVMAFHATPPSVRWLAPFTYGFHGVPIFFGISGLLICGKLAEEEEATGTVSLARFYWKRAFRILPPAFFFVAVLAALSALDVYPRRLSLRDALACLFFFRNYVPHATVSLPYQTNHFWSLSVEEHFYLVFPLLVALCGTRRLRWGAPLLALAVAAWRSADSRYGLFEAWYPGVHYWMRTDRVADGLLWGCAWALAARVEGLRALLYRALRPAVWCGLLALLAYVIVFTPPWAPLAEAFIVPPLLLGTIWYPQAWPGRLLESAALKWVGRLSYSLYLWQQLFFVTRSQTPRLLQHFPLNVLAVFACAAVSHYLVEKPLIAWGQQLARERPPRTSAASGGPQTP